MSKITGLDIAGMASIAVGLVAIIFNKKRANLSRKLMAGFLGKDPHAWGSHYQTYWRVRVIIAGVLLILFGLGMIRTE